MASLLSNTLRGLSKTASLTAAKSVVDFLATLALIHILQIPDPWGMFAFLLVGVDFFFRLSNLGGHRYLIQRQTVSRDDLRTVMTVEGALSLVTAAIWFFLGPVILTRMGHSELTSAAQIMTLWIITERMGQPARAMLEREMRFGRSNGSMFAGTVTLAAVSLALAAMGWGVLAIIVGKVAQSAVTSLGFWLCYGKPPRPGIVLPSLIPQLRFGFPLLPADLFQFYCWNAPVVIIVWKLGFGALGLYHLAFKLPHYMLQLQDLISTVVYPAFTRARDDKHLVAGFTLVTKYSAAVALLPVALVMSLGHGVTLHLLGEEFLSATTPLMVFTGLAAYRMITVHWYAAYLAKGRTAPLPYLMFLNACGVTIGALIGLRWGITGIAWGVAIPGVIVILYAINRFLRRTLPIRYFPALKQPVLVALAAGVVGGALRWAGLDIDESGKFWLAVLAVSTTHVGLGLLFSRRELRLLKASFFER